MDGRSNTFVWGQSIDRNFDSLRGSSRDEAKQSWTMKAVSTDPVVTNGHAGSEVQIELTDTKPDLNREPNDLEKVFQYFQIPPLLHPKILSENSAQWYL